MCMMLMGRQFGADAILYQLGKALTSKNFKISGLSLEMTGCERCEKCVKLVAISMHARTALASP